MTSSRSWPAKDPQQEQGSAGNAPRTAHVPVLLREVLECLDPRPGETHVDATVGAGGHATEVLARLGAQGLLIGIDRDSQALEIAEQRLMQVGSPFRVFQGTFSRLSEFLRLAGLPAEGAMDGLLLDLGVSSLQLDRADRGFSFLRDGPLDMRMAAGEGESAADFLARTSVEELERALRDYGEEPAWRKIARAIDDARRARRLGTTAELSRVVESVVPRAGKRTHPATRTFQGIRIAVNSELEQLRLILKDLDRFLRPGGRVVVLSYHSLEDRIVKESFRDKVNEGLYRAPPQSMLTPTASEVKTNPRARSARLRCVVREGRAGQ